MSTLKHVLASLALVIVGSTASVAHAQYFQQNFDGNGVPAGWVVTNNSTPIGTGRWGQGNENIFPSQAGAPGAYFTDSYLAASSNGGAVSDWLITPQMTLSNGLQITFWARTDGDPGDFGGNNLELRLSSSGASTSVGTGATGTGVFTTLLRAIDFDAIRSAGAWTQYSASITGLASNVSGRLAFRYVVDDTTIHGDLIGLDSILIVPEPEMALLLLAGLPLIGFGLRRKVRG